MASTRPLCNDDTIRRIARKKPACATPARCFAPVSCAWKVFAVALTRDCQHPPASTSCEAWAPTAWVTSERPTLRDRRLLADHTGLYYLTRSLVRVWCHEAMCHDRSGRN